MAAKLLLLLAASATAQLTTSFWMPKIFLGTERISYVASVVGADQNRLTLAASPANDTDYEALGVATGVTATYTFASTLFDYSTSELRRHAGASSGEYAYSFRCEMQTADTEADCTVSYGPGIAYGRCNTRSFEGFTSTQLWTFSETDTVGVETIVRSIPGSPTTPVPDWCSEASDAPAVPSSALVNHAPFSSDYFGTYKFIITAGEEKVSATTGGAVSTSSVKPTGYQAPSSGTGAAAPIRTIAPALAGLGAAVAVFL